jgi:nitroimidazol reductase NimA-like FMN-containing flavoprotein (pyridoxamine 5'-phosphate oxidase superfamily)
MVLLMSRLEGVLATYTGSDVRNQIRMTPDEVRSFLSTHSEPIACASLRSDGSVHLVAMNFALVDDILVMTAKSKSQKVQNLSRDPRISCLVEQGSQYLDIRGVSVAGEASLTDDSDQLREALIAIMMQTKDPATSQYTSEQLDQIARKRVVIRVQPTSIASWDHRRLVAGSR